MRPILLLTTFFALIATVSCRDRVSGRTDVPDANDVPDTNDVPDANDVAIQQLINNCVGVDTCAASDTERLGVGTCLDQLVFGRQWRTALGLCDQVRLSALECKLAAADCAGARACVPDSADFAQVCTGKGIPGGICSGTSLVCCDDQAQFSAVLDCGAASMQCDDRATGCGGCGTETCRFGIDKPTCDGDNILVQCGASGFRERINCASDYELVDVNVGGKDIFYSLAGEKCGDASGDRAGEKHCVGAGEACVFDQYCDGEVLVTCAGGRLSRRDCTKAFPPGSTCGQLVMGAYACGLFDTECDLFVPETCNGNMISFCALGKPATFDCLASGYTGCRTAPDKGGRPIAFCVP